MYLHNSFTINKIISWDSTIVEWFCNDRMAAGSLHQFFIPDLNVAIYLIIVFFVFLILPVICYSYLSVLCFFWMTGYMIIDVSHPDILLVSAILISKCFVRIGMTFLQFLIWAIPLINLVINVMQRHVGIGIFYNCI